MVDSKSTDKLMLLTQAAQRALQNDPAILDKVKSVAVNWVKVGDIIAPEVRLEFHPPIAKVPTGGVVG